MNKCQLKIVAVCTCGRVAEACSGYKEPQSPGYWCAWEQFTPKEYYCTNDTLYREGLKQLLADAEKMLEAK